MDMSQGAKAVYTLLDRLGLLYLSTAHKEAETMEDCKEISKTLGAPFCKNLFLCNRQQSEFFLLLMAEDKPFKTKDVSKTLGKARLSFGTEEHLYDMLRCKGGGISPMGLAFDKGHRVNLVIDEDIVAHGRFCVHPCDNTQSLVIKTKDFLDIFLKHTGHTPQIIHIDYPQAVEEN